MNKKTYLSKNPRDTGKIAKTLAWETLAAKKREHATIFALVGDLGSGKTTFTKSFIRALGIKKKILSPTFLIVKRFSLSRECRFRDIFHIDAYRISSQKNIKNIGIKEKFLEPENIILIEWADRVKNILPNDTIWIMFEHGEREKERHITFD
jgi:tRNA threonylcarbamoyladenosine biosynthesis protein TsaE